MLVAIFMNRELITVPADTPLPEAALVMSRCGIRRLLVTEPGADGPKLLGIVSSHDIARALPSDVNPASIGVLEGPDRYPAISTIMTRDVHTVAPGTPIEEAAHVLRTRKIGALPVLSNGHVVGIITESDIFDAFVDLTGVREGGVRVTFELGDDERIVGALAELGRRRGVRIASFLSTRHDGRRYENGQRIGVVRLVGRKTDALIDEIWRSGHPVLSIQDGVATDAEATSDGTT